MLLLNFERSVFRVELQLNQKMFIEPQQRFTIRKGTTTVGTGVFTENLPPMTEEEKVGLEVPNCRAPLKLSYFRIQRTRRS